MKLKVITHQEVETEHELPIFLYYQDELDYPTYIKIEEYKGKTMTTTVKVEHNKCTISRDYDAAIYSFNEEALTKEEYFNEALKDALADFGAAEKDYAQTMPIGSFELHGHEKLNWEEAESWLYEIKEAYESIGFAGQFGLIFIKELAERYEKGERTAELHEEIMGLQ